MDETVDSSPDQQDEVGVNVGPGGQGSGGVRRVSVGASMLGMLGPRSVWIFIITIVMCVVCVCLCVCFCLCVCRERLLSAIP